MSSSYIAVGTEIAPPLPLASSSVAPVAAPPTTIKELLYIVSGTGDKNTPMLRTTAARLSEFMNQPLDQLPIGTLIDVRFAFKVYLQDRRYSANSVRTYCHNTVRLLRWAEELGWVSTELSVEEAWTALLAALSGNPRAHTGIIRLAIRNGKTPAQFSSADIDAWGEEMLRSGRQYRTVRQSKWEFRKAVAQAKLGEYLPNLKLGANQTTYRIPLSDFPEPLRSEVQEILTWKLAPFAKGRPQKIKLRPVSAKLLESNICRLYGFARNIGNFAEINTLSSLFTEEVVGSFIEWGVNERNLSLSSLLRLSMLYGAMRHHPKYKTQDYSWFSPLFAEVPERTDDELKAKKAVKSVSFEVLQKIPEQIRSDRMKLDCDDINGSWLAQDELMIKWLTTLPWRQRNIRECRLGAPETSNLFFAPIPEFIHVARPGWVDEALKDNPKQSFWQFHFRPDETKTHHSVRGFLPRRLVSLLEEFLHDHRPRLVARADPGTLFLNRDGVALDYQIVTYHVSEIVLKYADRRMTPHLFRDAFAYAWLNAHPEDYLTLSKCLWHNSLKYTLSVYGKNFDESNGARRTDEWLGA